MDLTRWVAVIGAGLSVWMWLPGDGITRLRPAVPVRLPTWAQPLPSAMGSRIRWWIGGVTALLVVAYGWGWSPGVVVVGPVIAAGVWVGLGRLEPAGTRSRRLQTLYELPRALDLVRACVRAGQPLRNAIETVAQAVGPPISNLFGTVSNALSVGMSEAQAWAVLKEDPVIGFVARDLTRSATWGTAVVDVLAQHSVDLRRQGRAAQLAAAKSVGVKSVLPLGLCYLPAFMLIGVVPVIAAGLSGLFR
ncbi:MAG: type II secretion system F family protein [Propionibacteriaceae bacterium]|nr:type II secretion system F family protein [Propionibacteriaceae bacterium]